MKLENSTAIPDYVDSMGFDNVLREIALYAEINADHHATSVHGNPSCKRAFNRVSALLTEVANQVESILIEPDPLEKAMKQFQPTAEVE